LQTERTIDQLDLAIETYGYSFTPEVHKGTLDVREMVSQAITGKIQVLTIRLAAVSNLSGKTLNDETANGLNKVIDELIAAATKANNINPKD
jgi:hypothetical protein